MNIKPIENIIIVGGGTAGWVAASSLARVLPKQSYRITLVESDQIGIIGVGEATIPPIQDVHKMLGVDEADFIRSTEASFKLGIEFHNWSEQGSRYFHPFGQYGREFDSVSFHQYWMRARELGFESELSDFSLGTQMAKAGKFVPSNNDPQSILSSMGYAYHFDASLYAKFLRRLAEGMGVVRREGKVIDVSLDHDSGFIDTILMEDGEAISGDLFIDCTGFASILLGKTLGVEFEDWSHLLKANRAVAVPSQNVGETRPYTQSIAHPAGWQWRIPLQHRTGNGLVFCDDYLSEDEACQLLLSNLEGEALADPRVLRFRTGRRQQAWHKNCIAVGLSAGFLEPLESTAIHLVQTMVARLLQLFPSSGFQQADIDEFNQQFCREYDMVRDFIVLHYHVNQRSEPLWRDAREMAIPESLSHKIRLFESHGRFFERQDDLFKKASWLAVMMGQGLKPSDYDPIANRKPAAGLCQWLKNIQSAYGDAIGAMPDHDRFIAEYCRAKKDRVA
ncbi:MAG: tryptophan halogenase [Cellvibrionaceae bacterium]|nr:tryptophan halogenase [Cellvibrionaceae bacterium]|tara:strand:- start:5640 stop:7157 length:1518 start_codon:yes stop_codon:yes gene_type:complete